MIGQAAILALWIIAIHFILQDGNVLGSFRRFFANGFDKIFGLKISKMVQKPLWDCMPCMSAFWVIQLTWDLDVRLIFMVCGILVLTDKFIELCEKSCSPLDG